LVGFELEDERTAELELGAADDEEGFAELELGAADEDLKLEEEGFAELDKGTTSKLELGGW